MRACEFSVQNAYAGLTVRTAAWRISQNSVARQHLSMPKQKQLHVWISERDHTRLSAYAEAHDEKIGHTVRKLIRQLGHGAVVAPASQPVKHAPSPPALTTNQQD
jgi:hypothetical protein